MQQNGFTVHSGASTTHDHHKRDNRFGDTIQALLNLAAKEAGVDAGYGLYEFDQVKSQLTLLYAHGLRTPPAVLSFPLRGAVGLAGILDFGFLTEPPEDESRL